MRTSILVSAGLFLMLISCSFAYAMPVDQCFEISNHSDNVAGLPGYDYLEKVCVSDIRVVQTVKGVDVITTGIYTTLSQDWPWKTEETFSDTKSYSSIVGRQIFVFGYRSQFGPGGHCGPRVRGGTNVIAYGVDIGSITLSVSGNYIEDYGCGHSGARNFKLSYDRVK